MNPTQPTVQPNEGNPILRWARGRWHVFDALPLAARHGRAIVVGTFKFAFHHPIKAVFLAFLLWIALVGLQQANLDTAPKTPAGITQAALAGEQHAFGDLAWSGVRFADGVVGSTIELASRIVASFAVKVFNRIQQDYLETHSPTTGLPLR